MKGLKCPSPYPYKKQIMTHPYEPLFTCAVLIFHFLFGFLLLVRAS